MCDLTVGVFENIEITYMLDMDQKVKLTEYILIGPALNKHHAPFMDYKETANKISWYQWHFGSEKDTIMEYFGFVTR